MFLSRRPLALTVLLASMAPLAAQERVLAGANVQLYSVGTAGDGSAASPLLTKTVTTDDAGNFDLTGLYQCPTAKTLVYLAITGGNGKPGQPSNTAASLLGAIGPCGSLTPDSDIVVTEATTVGAVYGLLPFIQSASSVGAGANEGARLADAFTLSSQLVNLASGYAPGPVLPPATAAPVVLLDTLSNLVAVCIQASGPSAPACTQLFAATTPPGGTAPTDVVGALIDLARNPSLSTASLFNPPPPMVFSPALNQAPASASLPSPSPVTITPPNLTFPPTGLGSVSASQAIMLNNTGTTTADLTGSGFFGPNATDFVTTLLCPTGQTLPPGQSCTLNVVFAPSQTGVRTAFGELLPNPTTAAIFLPMTGTGTPQADAGLSASTNAVNFGSTEAGTLSASQTVTLTNNGPRTIKLTSGTLDGSNPSEFHVSNDCGGGILAANSTCNVVVSFAPSGQDSATATLRLNTDASNTPLVITFTGTGTPSTQP